MHWILCMMNQRKRDAGFSVSGVMGVVSLLGATAMVVAPGKDQSSAQPAGGFADQVTAELQRARAEAITSRVPQHAFVYSNRVEIRAARPGARPGTWIAPSAAQPALRTVLARPGIITFDVTNRPGLPSFVLSPTLAKEIVFNAAGNGTVAHLAPSRASVHLFISQDHLRSDHPDRALRIDIAPTSGSVSLNHFWQ